MGYYLINIYKYGYDLADYIIDNTKKETLEKMVEINPALQDLIDELGLEEVE
jgi:type I restriction enzyme R subunit